MNNQLDRILKFLNSSLNKNSFVEVKKIKTITSNGEHLENLNSLILYLEEDGYVQYNHLNDCIKLTPLGQQFISDGGYMNQNSEKKQDLSIKKWTLILSALFSVLALGFSIDQKFSENVTIDAMGVKIESLEDQIKRQTGTIDSLKERIDSLELKTRKQD